MDSLAERRHQHALAPPLVRADEAEQLAQRHHEGGVGQVRVRRARDRLGEHLGHRGGAPQRDLRAGLEGNQQHAERARALRLRHAVEVEGFGGGGRRPGRLARLARAAVGAARHRLQQLAGVVVVAAPQQRAALAGQAPGGVGLHGVVGHHHAARWRLAALGAPARLAGARRALGARRLFPHDLRGLAGCLRARLRHGRRLGGGQGIKGCARDAIRGRASDAIGGCAHRIQPCFGRIACLGRKTLITASSVSI